jgi:hypothetical protein
MANIKWQEQPFTVDVLGNDVNVFYYGNYGGPAYPDSSELVTKPNGRPLSEKQLSKTDLPAVDKADFFFYVHDVQSSQADTVQEQAAADVTLLKSLTYQDASYSSDPEAVLYDAITSFGMIGSLILNDSLGAASPKLLERALTDAVNDLTAGVQGLAQENPVELATIVAGLFNEPVGSTELTFDFTFPNIGAIPEATEFLVVNAVAEAINEPGDPSPYDFLSDDYQLALHFNPVNSTFDLDLLSA